MIPRALDEWTIERLQALMQRGVFENDRFDFKEQLPRDDKGKLRLRRSCAAFANSAGGFLVFGVRDGDGLAAEGRLVGLDPKLDFANQFGLLAATVQPSIAWEARNPAIALEGGNVVHVVHVQESNTKPHGVPDDDRWWFGKRTNQGTEPMSYEEVRDHFGRTATKRGEVAWLKAEVRRIYDRGRDLNIRAGSQAWTLDMLVTRFDVGQARLVLVAVYSLLDPTVIAELQALFERCARVESMLATWSAVRVGPGGMTDRAFASLEISASVRAQLPEIVTACERLIPKLEGQR